FGLLDQKILQPRLGLFSGLSQPSSPTPESNTLPEFVQLRLQKFDLRPILAPLGLCETVDQRVLVTAPRLVLDSADKLIDHRVVHCRWWLRPGFSHQTLLFSRELIEIPAKSLRPTLLQRTHHPQIRGPLVLFKVCRVEDTENSIKCLRAHGKYLQQVGDTICDFVPSLGTDQTVRRGPQRLWLGPALSARRGRPLGEELVDSHAKPCPRLEPVDRQLGIRALFYRVSDLGQLLPHTVNPPLPVTRIVRVQSVPGLLDD